jgi:hypothetical protein
LVPQHISAKNLKQSVSNFRDCLVVELIMEHRQIGPHKTFDMTFVRGDLKDLYVEHMQALCGFCTDKLLPLLDGCVTREPYLAIATRQHFESYFKQYKKRCGWDENLVSPYEVPSFGGFNDMSTTPLALCLEPLKPPRRCSCKKSQERPCCHLLTLALKERNRFLLPEAFLRIGGAAHFVHGHQNWKAFQLINEGLIDPTFAGLILMGREVGLRMLRFRNGLEEVVLHLHSVAGIYQIRVCFSYCSWLC